MSKYVVEPVDVRPFCRSLVNPENLLGHMDVAVTKNCAHNEFKLESGEMNLCFPPFQPF